MMYNHYHVMFDFNGVATPMYVEKTRRHIERLTGCKVGTMGQFVQLHFKVEHCAMNKRDLKDMLVCAWSDFSAKLVIKVV